MTSIRNFSAHVVAAATALALSIVLIGGTVTVPTSPAAAHVEFVA